MLREVARGIDQLLGELHHLIEPRVGGIEAGLARFLLLHAGRRPAPQHAGERADGVVGKPERLADFADRAAAAIADDGGGEVGVVAAVFLVDVLDHLLAPLVLEIDVDVGRLLALLRDEALEQKVDVLRIHLGDLEAIADHRIRRGAAPLAQNALGAREADDIVYGEEVGRVVQLARHLELAVERLTDLRADTVRIAPFRSLLGQRHQRLLRAREADAVLVGVFGALQLLEREFATIEEAQRAVDRFGHAAEQPRHLLRAFQVALRIGFEQPAGRIDGDVLTDAGHDVLQWSPLRRVIEHVVDGDERNERSFRQWSSSRSSRRLSSPR